MLSGSNFYNLRRMNDNGVKMTKGEEMDMIMRYLSKRGLHADVREKYVVDQYE